MNSGRTEVPSPRVGPDEPGPARRVSALTEVLLAVGGATLVAAALYRVPGIEGWFHAVVSLLFLYLPAWLLRRRDLADYGLTSAPLGANLALFGLFVLVVFPLFSVGFYAWTGYACAHPALHPIAPGNCLAGIHWAPRLPREALQLAAAEVLVVALPEEFFFRGYVQGRLAEAWPARRRILGAPVGAALLVASLLFALCHVVVQGNLGTLAVFFPSLLFGWMRARTGSILPGVLFHAACNLLIETLARSAFGG